MSGGKFDVSEVEGADVDVARIRDLLEVVASSLAMISADLEAVRRGIESALTDLGVQPARGSPAARATLGRPDGEDRR
jgi:hypothetical protein